MDKKIRLAYKIFDIFKDAKKEQPVLFDCKDQKNDLEDREL